MDSNNPQSTFQKSPLENIQKMTIVFQEAKPQHTNTYTTITKQSTPSTNQLRRSPRKNPSYYKQGKYTYWRNMPRQTKTRCLTILGPPTKMLPHVQTTKNLDTTISYVSQHLKSSLSIHSQPCSTWINHQHIIQLSTLNNVTITPTSIDNTTAQIWIKKNETPLVAPLR